MRDRDSTWFLDAQHLRRSPRLGARRWHRNWSPGGDSVLGSYVMPKCSLITAMISIPAKPTRHEPSRPIRAETTLSMPRSPRRETDTRSVGAYAAAIGAKADIATKPSDKDARDAHLDLWSAINAWKYSLHGHLAAFGREISDGDALVERTETNVREREAEIEELGLFDDPPDDDLPPWVDLDIAWEVQEKDREAMLGVSFVLCQTRLAGVAAEADRFYEVLEKVLGLPSEHFPRGKQHLARGEKLAGFDYSRVRVIWELANYFKHADQWTSDTWKNPGRREKQTVEVAKALGFKDYSSLNLKHGAQSLGVKAGREVEKLAEDVTKWAELIFSEAQEAMAPLPPEPDPGF